MAEGLCEKALKFLSELPINVDEDTEAPQG